MWKKSFGFFEKGMKDFEAIGDSTNTALLLCNTGRLMRICAQAHCNVSGDEGRGEFSPEEALYYNKVTLKCFLKFCSEHFHLSGTSSAALLLLSPCVLTVANHTIIAILP